MFVKETEWLKVEHHRLQSRGEEGDNEKALLSKVLYMYICTLLISACELCFYGIIK